MLRDEIVRILITWWQLINALYLILVWLTKPMWQFGQIEPKKSQNLSCQTCVAGCVHEGVTSCSSWILIWGWSLWKAGMMPFNFGIHSWSWFMLEIGEKISNFLVFSCCQGRFGNFSKCWKMWHFLFLLILINPQLEIHDDLNFDYVDTFVVCRKIYHLSIGSQILVAWIASYGPWKWGI